MGKKIDALFFFCVGLVFMYYVFTTHTNTAWNTLYNINDIQNTTEIWKTAINATSICENAYKKGYYTQYDLDLCRTNKLNRWVYYNIKYDLKTSAYIDNAQDTLSRGTGVCRHKATLLCSMLRSIGTNCNINTRYTIINNVQKGHMVSEIVLRTDANQTVIEICDPTTNTQCSIFSIELYEQQYDKPLYKLDGA